MAEVELVGALRWPVLRHAKFTRIPSTREMEGHLKALGSAALGRRFASTTRRSAASQTQTGAVVRENHEVLTPHWQIGNVGW
jgi:hypothetical protein